MSEFTSEDGMEYHMWWDSLSEFDGELENLCSRANGTAWHQYKTNAGGDQWGRSTMSWFGASSYNAAVDKVRNGSPELRQLLEERVEKLKCAVDLATVEAVTIEVRRRKRSRQDYGDTLDIHRVWGGQLDKAWERPTRRTVLAPTQRYATIYADLSMVARYSYEHSLWRAATVYCIYEMLTRMGINTEVWSGQSGHGMHCSGPYKHWQGVCIKRYTDVLNDEHLAVMLSGTFFRSFGFGMLFASKYKVYPHLGFPYKGLVKPLRDRQEAGERVFRVGDALDETGAVQTLKSIVEQLKEEYRKLGEVA